MIIATPSRSSRLVRERGKSLTSLRRRRRPALQCYGLVSVSLIPRSRVSLYSLITHERRGSNKKRLADEITEPVGTRNYENLLCTGARAHIYQQFRTPGRSTRRGLVSKFTLASKIRRSGRVSAGENSRGNRASSANRTKIGGPEGSRLGSDSTRPAWNKTRLNSSLLTTSDVKHRASRLSKGREIKPCRVPGEASPSRD